MCWVVENVIMIFVYSIKISVQAEKAKRELQPPSSGSRNNIQYTNKKAKQD